MGGEDIVMKQMMQHASPFRRAEDDEQLFDSGDEASGSSTSNLTEDDEEEDDGDHAALPLNQPSSTTTVDTSGPLYELSSLLVQLPIKRGLSKYYEGKSQSYSSLSNVNCIEDLPKKENRYRRKLKPSKSYAGVDASQKRCYAPGPLDRSISKKISRGSSCASLITRRTSSHFLGSSKPPAIPVNRNL